MTATVTAEPVLQAEPPVGSVVADRDGTLVGTVMQEGLIRVRDR